ncbi:carnitine racemase, putative [Mycobacteroides abscessus subsp. massiliense]|uniref:carnitine racemase n=1 Tax=Mycobacteroides abscessus TaxID=36809 RepID=UPI0009A72D52|nr:carnitine racemase [Mycobacteroides abscessus]SLH42322.1 carnitine racemase, putative [Mycobacteroides abscessus subsp. massiliense]
MTLTAEKLTPADAAVGSLVHALAANLDPAALHAAVQQALLAGEIHLGDAVFLGELVPDVIAAEVWHGEAVLTADEALRVGMGYVAAAIVAGAHP